MSAPSLFVFPDTFNRFSSIRQLIRTLTLSLFLTQFNTLSTSQAATHGLDQNGNALNDVWEVVYGNLPANADPDSDGFTNAQENDAGTNPFDPFSHPPTLSIQTWSSSSLRLDWKSVPGKRYQLFSSTNLVSNTWAGLDSVIASNPRTTTAFIEIPRSPLPASAVFYKLQIDDIDTDKDGLTDWEERALGFDPTTSHTDRQDTPDLGRVSQALRTRSVITLGTLDSTLSERWPDPGLVAIRRANGLQPLTVHLAFSGNAQLNQDYTCNPGTNITFPAGVREQWIELTPLADDDESESTETITVTVLPDPDYTVGTQKTAELKLENATSTSGPSAKEAARFLIQAAFGPDQDSPSDSDDIPENVEQVMSLGFDAWIEDQFQRPEGFIQPWVDWAVINGSRLEIYGNWKEHSWWARAMGTPKLRPDATTETLPDPLRQRVAFALSEILVVSDRPEQLATEPAGMANYYDLMIRHAFGNYRDLLFDVATHPAMGIYLSHLGNQKADPSTKIYPDENFAREIMQLFTIGLWELNPDGTRKLDAEGQPISTYDNSDITELARVFTGFSFGNNATFTLWPRDFTVPMKCWDAYHDLGPKTLLGGLKLPVREESSDNQGAAGLADVHAAVDHLFAHPNVGPFIGKQLIQRLVTSNPTTGYVARVSAAFTDNGAGIRGDMKSVIKAILLDPEARSYSMINVPTWGKLREPFLRVVNFARAFNASSTSGYFPLDQFTLDHLQDPMNAPSVFNFFLPAHSPPGPLTQLGLVAPEFQIINASSAITGPNYFWDDALQGSLHTQGAGNPAYAVRANFTPELSMIVQQNRINDDVPPDPKFDPDPLLQRLDLVLTGGTLTPPQFQIIREAMLRINAPSWQWHRERLRLAVYLIVTSPEFNVLR